MPLRAIMHVYRLYRGIINVAMASGVVAVVLAVSLITAPTAGAISIGGPSDCDTNALVSCGVHSTSAVIGAYNSSAYVRAVYAYFGINQADMANLPANNVAGRVTKDGNVFIDGQSRAVATDAVTAGRQDIPGSTQVSFQGATFFKRPPSVSFQQDSLPAFISMDNGRFQFAIIASCGNVVRAAPTAPPQQAAVGQARAVSRPQGKPPVKPAAAPAPTQTQSQSQEVNVNNTNINKNTQVNNQSPAPETVTQTQPAATAATAQPATQNTSSNLPNTGPAGTVGIFLASVGAGVLAYRRFLLRQFEKQS